MKLLILSTLLAVSLASSLRYDEVRFAQFKEQFGKQYHTRSEHQRRFNIFSENLKKYEEHNKSGASWTMGVNQFSDLTEAEFDTFHMGGYKKTPVMSPTMEGLSVKEPRTCPPSVDWREKGAVIPVKDQGSCGSCWAFCTTEMIESYAAISSNNLPVLSAQQVTSCTPNTLSCGGTGGCMGSIPQLGYTYLQLFGHVTEDDWPYTSGSGATGDCEYDYNGMPPAVGLTGYNTLTPNDQDAVMTHLAEVGPLAVAGYASGWGGYGGGIYEGCSYDSNIALNHAVQLVGYGTDESLGDYWIVRNSWGDRWGEDGYIRLRRSRLRPAARLRTVRSPLRRLLPSRGPRVGHA